MISFYPGPSRVYDEIPSWVSDAHTKGILGMNHRSPEFMELARETIALLKLKLQIPKDYTVLFASSATECWEIIAQSLITKKSIHLYNGAFGEKWYEYTHRIKPEAQSVFFDPEEELDPARDIFENAEVICLTQNETSNGTQVSNRTIKDFKNSNSHALIAVDATSSMAGIYLDFHAADIWFASVQKCFGLPAGLAVMICSTRAISKMQTIGERNYYNSLSFMKEMIDKYQTPFTPNVLGIYLVMRSMKKVNGIKLVDKRTVRRFREWVKFFSRLKGLNLMVTNRKVLSNTVLAIQGNEKLIQAVKVRAKKKGLLLGEGYGKLRPYSFRIANFPALKEKEIKLLMAFLRSHTNLYDER